MSLEYRTGFCKECKADRKLVRKTPNHILHFLITVVLGTFTYGIGSAVWICIWFLLSLKENFWTCHVCGSHNEESNSHDAQQRIEQPKLIDNLKKHSKLIVALFISIAIVLFIVSFDFDQTSENNDTSKKTQKKQSKENKVNATVDIKAKDTEKKKNLLKTNDLESGLCYLYDIKKSSDALSGSVSCKEGKLTMNFYDSETKDIVDTKIVEFKDSKFYIKIDDLENKDFKPSITLTKKQKEQNQQQSKKNINQSIISVNSSTQDGENKNTLLDKCTIQNWKYSKYSNEYLVIDGKTTCKKGKLIIQIFDENDNNLGTQSDYIESGIFSIFFKTDSNPSDIAIKYTITEE